MNGYKKVIKSGKMRMAILNMLRFLPDSLMLSIQYRIKLGRKLDLKNPKRYTEKLQWYKMHYRNPVMHQCVDKYLAREYVKGKGLEEILVKLIGKYDSVNDIDWDNLPNQFVIKTTHGSGGNNVVICPDKTKLDVSALKGTLETSSHPVKTNTAGREWAYYGLHPGIIVEELLVNSENPKAGINDYKIFCYNGVAKYVVLDADRYIGHKRNIYDREWNDLRILSDCPAVDREIPKPQNLDELLEVAEKLSEGFPYVRIDLYDVDSKIYFGELTFYPWSGYVQFEPDEWDTIFGEDFNLIRWGK
ncbi:MAG: carbonic anhydrase [Acetatifactor sp.]|nr:carbonic anhydrase [Acetatifactor sp.]